jgi:hypothetical protein
MYLPVQSASQRQTALHSSKIHRFSSNKLSLLILFSNSSKAMKANGMCFILWHRPKKNTSAGFQRYINLIKLFI